MVTRLAAPVACVNAFSLENMEAVHFRPTLVNSHRCCSEIHTATGSRFAGHDGEITGALPRIFLVCPGSREEMSATTFVASSPRQFLTAPNPANPLSNDVSLREKVCLVYAP